MVLASDASDNIYLAGFTSDTEKSATLSIETTATALARMIGGVTPDGTTASRFTSDIEKSAEFPNLVRLVSEALSAGLPPLEDPRVSDSIALTLYQVSKGDRSATLKTAAAVVEPSVTTPLPYEVLNNGFLNSYTIWAVGADGGKNGVRLRNGITINYAAYGSLPDDGDTVIPTGSASPDGIQQVVLPAHNPFFDILGGSSLDATITVPGNGEAWNLTVLQTPLTRTQNGIQISQQIMKSAVQLGELRGFSLDCVATAAVGVIGSAPVADWASYQSFDAGLAALDQSLSSRGTWVSFAELLRKCTIEAAKSLSPEERERLEKLAEKLTSSAYVQKLAPFLNRFHKAIYTQAKRIGLRSILKGVAIAGLVYDAINTSIRIAFFVNHWNEKKTVGICQAKDDAGALQIVNCARRFALSPDPLSLLVGDNYTLTTRAFNAEGQETLVPSGVRYTSSNPAVSVSSGGVVTALAKTNGTVITASYDPTGARGASAVTVAGVSAALEVSPTSIEEGGSATLSWSSVYANACNAGGAWSGAKGIAGSETVRPQATGQITFTISCSGPGGPATSSATLTIVPRPVTGPSTAWIKYEYDFPVVNFPYTPSGFTSPNPGTYIPANIKRADPSYPSLGDIDFLRNNEVGYDGSNYNISYRYYYGPPLNYDSVHGDQTTIPYVYAIDVTFYRRRITAVVVDPGFEPTPITGGNITVPNWIPGENGFQSISKPAYRWEKTTAIAGRTP